MVVTRERHGVSDDGRRRVERACEHEALGQRADHLAICRDGEALHGVWEVDEDHRALGHLLHEPLVPALFDDLDLPGERARAVVVERPVGVLRLVRALGRRKEGLLQGLPVVRDGNLRQDDGQAHALEQVGDLLGLTDPRDERRGLLGELLGRDKLHPRREELLKAAENSGVVDRGLDQAEVAVGIHVLALDRGKRDAPAGRVHEQNDRVLQDDLHLAAEQGMDGLVAALVAATGKPDVAQERLGLTLGQAAPHCVERIVGSHGRSPFRLDCPKSVLPLTPGPRGFLVMRRACLPHKNMINKLSSLGSFALKEHILYYHIFAKMSRVWYV